MKHAIYIVSYYDFEIFIIGIIRHFNFTIYTIVLHGTLGGVSGHSTQSRGFESH